ncbi:MAG: biotin/lipoyl-containing protein [Myxococcota bacterium]
MARKTTYFAKNLGQKDGAAKAVEVESLGNGLYAVTLDDHRFEIDSLVLPHGAVSMIVEDTSYNVDFDGKGDEVAVLVRGEVVRFDIADERRLRMRAAASTFHAEGKQTVTAPMPGKIVKVFVKPGDEVQEGQGLVVVEAMKMENELKSPKAGKVIEVHAKEGTAVENGAKLVIVE